MRRGPKRLRIFQRKVRPPVHALRILFTAQPSTEPIGNRHPMGGQETMGTFGYHGFHTFGQPQQGIGPSCLLSRLESTLHGEEVLLAGPDQERSGSGGDTQLGVVNTLFDDVILHLLRVGILIAGQPALSFGDVADRSRRPNPFVQNHKIRGIGSAARDSRASDTLRIDLGS